jgi:hypothetical protein
MSKRAKRVTIFSVGKKSQFFFLRTLFCFLSLLAYSTFVYADPAENLGTFRFSEFSLKPLLHVQEENNSEFSVQTTYLGFEWKRDENLRGQLLLGSSDMIQPAVWFGQPNLPAFGIVEAYLEGRSPFGDFRAGLVDLEQGYEGAVPEWAWVLPPTHFHQNGWLINRDFGFQFRFATYPFRTLFTISNGESSATNPDNKFWYSGLWELKNSEGLGVLMTAQEGETTPLSTNGTNPSIAATTYKFVFNPAVNSKIRVGTLAVFKDDGHSLYLIEAGSGDILQSGQTNSFAFGHVDVAWHVGGDTTILARVEQDQANNSNYATAVTSSSLGLMLTSKDKLQSFTLMGTVNQNSTNFPSNELQVIFRLNSRYLN